MARAKDSAEKDLCLLGKDMKAPHSNCATPVECQMCGFNPQEARRRKQMIQDGALQVNPWGSRQLFLGRREGSENASKET